MDKKVIHVKAHLKNGSVVQPYDRTTLMGDNDQMAYENNPSTIPISSRNGSIKGSSKKLLDSLRK